MKILYLSTAPVPETWAHVLQIMRTCDALARTGAEVELVVPRRKNLLQGDPFSFFGMKPSFTVRYLPAVDLMSRKLPFAFSLLGLTFFISFMRYMRRVPKGTVLYVRGELVLPIAYVYGKQLAIFWETHIKPRRMRLYQKIFSKIHGVITVTESYRRELIDTYAVPENKVVCIPDGVNLREFNASISLEAARTACGLPTSRKIVLYTGSDIGWKGLDTLREATLLLPPEYLVVFVGEISPGAPDDRLYFAGLKPHREIPTWLAAADVLVLTGTTKSESSVRYTSPLKLFEYMAAGRPIVSVDLPSFREVLDEQVAYFASADSPAALAEALQRAVEDPMSHTKVERARALVAKYSWEERARRIIDFVTPRLATQQ